MSSFSIFGFEGTVFREIADVIQRVNQVQVTLATDNSKMGIQAKKMCALKLRWVQAYSMLATIESIASKNQHGDSLELSSDLQITSNLMSAATFSYRDFVKQNADIKCPQVILSAEYAERSAQNLRAVTEELSTNLQLDVATVLREAALTMTIFSKKSDQHFFVSKLGKYYVRAFRGIDYKGNVSILRA